MILKRYISLEIFKTSLGITLVVAFVFLGNQFVKYLSASATGHLFGAVVGKLLLIQVPYLLALLLPLGLFLGIILAFSRLYVDHEMVACFSFGISLRNLVGLCLGIGTVVAFLVLLLNFWIVPYLTEKQQVILQKAKSATLLQAIAPGRFLSFAQGRNIAYVAHVSPDGEHFEHVFLATQTEDAQNTNQWDVMIAENGYTYKKPNTQDHYLVTTQGYRYMGIPGQQDYKVIHYGKYGVLSEEADSDLQVSLNERAVPFQTLWQNLDKPKYFSEFQWRLSLPLSVFVLVLLAVPLSKVAPRQGRFAKILPAILLYIIYANLLLVMRNSLAHDQIPAWLGMWWIHLIFTAIALGLLKHQQGWRKTVV